MALISETEFRSSQYADIADNISQLGNVIASAEDYVERYLDRKIAKATYTEHHFQRQKFLFPRQYPIISIATLQRRKPPTEANVSPEWEPLDTALIRHVHPEAPILEYLGDDLRDYEVEIVYEAGYDPTPPAIKQAVILQTVIMSAVDLGVFGADDGKKPGYLYLQGNVHRYLNPYKRLRRFY